MQKIDFSDIFKSAWKITWRNRYLWWLGFFMFSGSGLGNFSYRGSGQDQALDPQLAVFLNFLQNHLALVRVAFLGLAILFLTLLVLGMFSRAAAIRSINDLQLYRNLGLWRLLKVGANYFWKILFLEILLAVGTFFLILILVVPTAVLFYLKAWALGIFLALWALAILLPALFLLYILRQYATLFLVLTDCPIGESLKKAYGLFKLKIKESLLMALWLILSGFAFGFLVLASLLPVALVFLLVGLILYIFLAQAGILVALILAALVWLGLVLYFGSLYEIFKQSAWVIFFKEISLLKIEEKKEEAEKVSQVVPSPEAV